MQSQIRQIPSLPRLPLTLLCSLATRRRTCAASASGGNSSNPRSLSNMRQQPTSTSQTRRHDAIALRSPDPSSSPGSPDPGRTVSFLIARNIRAPSDLSQGALNPGSLNPFLQRLSIPLVLRTLQCHRHVASSAHLLSLGQPFLLHLTAERTTATVCNPASSALLAEPSRCPDLFPRWAGARHASKYLTAQGRASHQTCRTKVWLRPLLRARRTLNRRRRLLEMHPLGCGLAALYRSG